MKSKSKKLLIVLGAVVLLGGLGAVSMLQGGSKGTVVQVDLAKIQDISEKVAASGRIQPQTKVDITSQVSAEIVGLRVNEGDVVAKGDLLIELDRVQLRSDMEQAQYSLDEIQARADAARVQRDRDLEEYERQEQLYEKKLNSVTDYTSAKYAYENSAASYVAWQSQVKTQRARLEKAQDNLERTTITSPMDGVVTFLAAEVGEIAQAQTAFTQGKTLMTISDLSVFEVDVEVDETEIAKIDLGQPAEIEVDAFQDSVFAGTVVEIGNSAVMQGQGTQEFSINFRVKVRFEQTRARIRPGMSASVDITTSTEEDVVIVPYAAIVMRETPEDTTEESATEDSSDGLLVSNVNAAENGNSHTDEDSEGADDAADGDGDNNDDEAGESGGDNGSNGAAGDATGNENRFDADRNDEPEKL
ncbi:MAG: efflux RND transporter periplasmic adaptor subunit, partial [Candidatus Zixiibacteriota bacterium]